MSPSCNCPLLFEVLEELPGSWRKRAYKRGPVFLRETLGLLGFPDPLVRVVRWIEFQARKPIVAQYLVIWEKTGVDKGLGACLHRR